MSMKLRTTARQDGQAYPTGIRAHVKSVAIAQVFRPSTFSSLVSLSEWHTLTPLYKTLTDQF